jgi:hypothetical protein
VEENIMPESPYSSVPRGPAIPEDEDPVELLQPLSGVVTEQEVKNNMSSAVAAAQAALNKGKTGEEPITEDAKIDVAAKQSEVKAELEAAGISEELKREYIRSLLAGERFTQSTTLFGGTVHVTFRTRAVLENKITRKIADASEEAGTKEHAKYLEELRLAYSLEVLTIGDKTILLDDVVQDDRVNLNILYEMHDIVYYAILKEFRVFEAICDFLFNKANDPNF